MVEEKGESSLSQKLRIKRSVANKVRHAFPVPLLKTPQPPCSEKLVLINFSKFNLEP